MGNCQAAEATTVVIQHPEGKLERLYWPTTAADVMKSNPGHHVALVTLYVAAAEEKRGNGTVRFTRVRLLNPKDMLLIGQVYRLITTQEVNKALRARKQEKTIRAQSELLRKHRELQQSTSTTDQTAKIAKRERNRPKSAAAPRQWRPSLQSISEGLS